MAAQDNPPAPPAADPLVGRRIGRYRLLRRLGEGGMGVVYLGEREGEYRKRVAVKLVRWALESPEVLRRFHTERQTLAALSHPNIVTLLDGGTTEDGLPYLVMDYLEGQPIDEYCDARSLSLAERLRLFIQVTAAVQYAHQNLIVHCDLKPSNILVTAEGLPKLLDFGIAKLLAPASLGMAGQLTQAGQRPFTPAYASPEQVRGEPVTTATDVYALGVILFWLLTGQSPYRCRTESAADIISAVCVQEPERPSSAVPREKKRRLEGDLDAILLKALRKEPQHRYGSVEQFTDDLRRHLGGRPVLARGGAFRYRASKFMLRNKITVAAAALTALAVTSGVVGVAWQAGVALRAKARAEQRFNDVRKLTNFLLFDFHDAVQKLPGSTPVQELLVQRSLGYLDSLAREAAGDPSLQCELVEAYIRFGDVQGNPYTPNLGDTQGALSSYGKALAIAEPLSRADPGNLRAARAQARVHSHMGDVLFLLRQMAEATSHTRQAAAVFEKLAAAQPRDLEARMDLAGCHEGLGDQLAKGLGDTAGARQSYQKSLQHWEEALRIDPQEVRARRAPVGLNMKIADLQFETDPRGALESLRKGLAVLGTLPQAEQTSVASRRLEGVLRRRMGDCLWELDDTKGSLESYRQASENFAALAALDPANSRAQFDLVVTLNSLGQTLEVTGDLAGALRNYGLVVDLLEGLAKTDPTNASWRTYLSEILVRIGGLLQKTGQAAEAHRQTARGLRVAKELAEKPDTPPAELTRAARLLLNCQPAEFREPQAALRYSQRAVVLTKEADAYALDTLAEAYLQTGDRAAASVTVQKGLALLPAAPGQQASWLRRLLEAKRARLVGASP
jgi:tetratricopeptide (TPR) repeat protein